MTTALRIIYRAAPPHPQPVAYPPLFHEARRVWAALSARRHPESGLVAVTIDQVMALATLRADEARSCLAWLEATGALEAVPAPQTLLDLRVYRVLVPLGAIGGGRETL